MTYEELKLLYRQYIGARNIYLSSHPEETDMLDKRLAIDAVMPIDAKGTVADYTSFVRAVADELEDRIKIGQKEVLTADEVSKYLGISKSYLYKLTMRGEIPHFKPMGKICYFSLEDVLNWITQTH